MDEPGLVEVALPPPTDMVVLWARLVEAARLRETPDADGEGDAWHYAPGTGDWADLRLLPDGRALLLGYRK